MDEKNNISGERNLPKICDVSEVSVKELFAELTVQSALKQLLPIRLPVMVKKVRKSYENKETHTKKAEAANYHLGFFISEHSHSTARKNFS